MSFIALRGRGPCTVIVLALAVTLALTPAIPASADPACPHNSYRLPPGTPGGITLEISPICISPDGNRLADTVTIHGTTGGGALDWTVIVTNGAGEVVDKIMRNGADATLVWDGRNTAGQRVAEGTYTMQVQLECEQVASTPVPTVPHVPPVPWSELSDGISFTCGDAEPIPVGDSVNYLLASTTITVDLTAPAIQGFTVSNSAFSPNGDGVKDSTAFSATLDDADASWTLNVVSPLNAALRSFEGTGATVAATWDGTDGTGAAVAEGTYRAILTATDAAQNSRTDVIGVINDITPPVVTAMSHRDGSNTLILRPTLSATISDTSAGIDGGASTLRLGPTVLSTFGQSVVGATDPQNATGVPAAALTLDQDQTWSVQAKDMAGNAVTQERLFRVVNIHQEPLIASIAPVTATVPDCSDPVFTATGCSVTFRDVLVGAGIHTIAISSSAHAGIGEFTRQVELGAASVRWPTPAGIALTNPGLPPSITQALLTLDVPMSVPLEIPVSKRALRVGDVTVPVPPAATPGGTVTLAMDPITVPAPCVDTSTAQNPATCGGPSNAIADPLPQEYQFAYPDPALTEPTTPIEEIIAGQDAAMPPDDGVPPMLADLSEMKPNSLPPSGDTSAIRFGVGDIEIKVTEGSDPLMVIADHGGLPADIALSLKAPFTETEQEVGLDRWYRVNVVPGSEKTKLTEYAADARVEYAQLDPVDGGGIGASCSACPNDPGTWNTTRNATSPQGRQWNLSLGVYDGWVNKGVHPLGAWALTHGEPGNNKRVDMAIIDSGFRRTHEDLVGKIKNHAEFPDWDKAASCTGGLLGGLNTHGTWVAGINADTDNAKGVAGVNWGGYLVPISVGVKASDCTFLENERSAWIRKATQLNVTGDGRVGVINESLMFQQEAPDGKECDAIEAAWRMGVVVVTAAPYGSSGRTFKANWPTKCNFTLGTTASTTDGSILPTVKDGAKMADVAAPGMEIWTTDGQGAAGAAGDKEYVKVPYEGSSVAAPHVSGLVQLLQQLGAPVYSSFNTPRWSATPVGGQCDGHQPAPSCKGRINVTSAVKSTLRNGVFAPWSGTGDHYAPENWKRGGRCATDSAVWRGPDASNGGGGHSVAMSCRGDGSVYLTTRVAVNPGWKYRLSAKARRGGGNTDATSTELRVCFYKNDPWKDNSNPSCKGKVSSGTVLATNWQDQWEFTSDKAPDDAAFAMVILRAWPTSDGWIAWDDVGLSAFRQ